MRGRYAIFAALICLGGVPFVPAGGADLGSPGGGKQSSGGKPVSFLACPVAQDTGPNTDVCFFVEYHGQRFGLPELPDWGSPQLMHEVLVEGHTESGVRVCGGTALKGRASVMQEIDAGCNTLVPYQGSPSEAPAEPLTAREKALARQVAKDPAVSVLPAYSGFDYPRPPQPPYKATRFAVSYPFDSDRGPALDMMSVRELAVLAMRSRARVDVRGFRADSRLMDGHVLEENAGMAEDRARKIAGILVGLGVSPQKIHVSWQGSAIPGSGDDDWRSRKVEIAVTPSPTKSP